ncbi:isoprenylcysteine carboxylmethyltransferase family protein [Bradyrhizobium prioriisuperbiae]|uniref:methyltransferase family protein n=1 Tax=Bradyrhizobium prioriisuperbiae TaxID=2854389 RepID=UPI0028E36594|nr:isoprenylcysteine carboxylmethyltransferase family protein [Bradyrhizobium prioritasuperba]
MIVKMIVQTLISFGVMGALLFLGAGTLHWPAAWVFTIGMTIAGLIGGLLMAHYDPALLKERMAPPIQKDQPAADKMFVWALGTTMLAWLVLMGLDVVRFGWSQMPLWLQWVGGLVLCFGVWFTYRVMRENSFAAPVVKIQKERAQTVISTGPYGFVRHPMYLGMLFLFPGIALLLGSWWGVVIAFGLVLLLCARIPLEEKVLRAGLDGYDAYTRQVRYRLIPGLW